MRTSFLPSITIGASLVQDRLVEVEIPRGTDLDDVVQTYMDGKTGRATGAELRMALLSIIHPPPWSLSRIGAERLALQMDSERRSSTIAHMDAAGVQAPAYWLYSRGASGRVHLTRWTRAGRISRELLLEQGGISPAPATKAAANRALQELVAEGLPRVLQVTLPGSDREVAKVEAPQAGWLDLEPGGLNCEGALPIHAVDDLGEWPGDVLTRLD